MCASSLIRVLLPVVFPTLSRDLSFFRAPTPASQRRVSTLILFHHAAEYKLASVTPHRRQKVT
jgi:hypothetical protein